MGALHVFIIVTGLSIFLVGGAALFVLGRRAKADFARMATEMGLRPRTSGPLDREPWPDHTVESAYDLTLRSGTPATLLFLSRRFKADSGRTPLIGIHLPSETSLPDGWLDGWRSRVDEDRSKVFPVHTHAERLPDGATVIVRAGGQIRRDVESFVGEIVESIG